METVFTIFLFVHIVTGFTALVAAPVAMIVKKGARSHRNWGKLYFWCMAVVCISAFVMSVLHENMFLFMVSGFSFYLVSSGYRWLYRKKITSVKDVKAADWILILVSTIFNSGLLVYGIAAIVRDPAYPFGYIASVFGIIGVRLIISNIKSFYNPHAEKNAWLLNHIGGMVGGYIATVSAFSAVNFSFLPGIIRWLWPTIIGVPLLLSWIRYYRKKFSAGKKLSELVELKAKQ